MNTQKKKKKKSKILQNITSLQKEKNCTFLEAAILYCEDKNINVEVISKLINKTQHYKNKIRKDANELNLLKK